MQSVNKLPSTAQLPKPNEKSGTARQIETTGDLRRFLGNIALAVAQGNMKPLDAAVAVKACEQINMSLYSEIKSAAIQAAAKREVPPLGSLRIDGEK